MKKFFKRSMAFVIMLVVLCTTLCGCGSKNYKSETVSNKERNGESISYGPFKQIPGEEENGLFYHEKTLTVYVVFDTNMSINNAVLAITPYIEHNTYWEYRDGKIVPDKSIPVNEEGYTLDEKWDSLTDEEKEELLKNK